jgi:RNA polymerase sigma-32 factor
MAISTNAQSISATQRYFHDLQNHSLLSRNEEIELSRRYHEKNDQAALGRLITGNLRLVVKIAKDFYKIGNVPLLDLIQEGNLGLIKAAEKFDPDKQTKFSYYAAFWIKAYIHKYLMDNHRTVRIGTTQAQRKLFFNLKKTHARLSQMGIDPTPEAIAKELKVKAGDVLEMQMRLDHPDLSLNAPLRDTAQGERLDRIRANAPSAAKKVENHQFISLVRNKTSQFKSKHLDDREKVILERRILSHDPETLQTLGSQFGVSRERIRQVEKRIIHKLKQYLFKQIPDMKQFAFQ